MGDSTYAWIKAEYFLRDLRCCHMVRLRMGTSMTSFLLGGYRSKWDQGFVWYSISTCRTPSLPIIANCVNLISSWYTNSRASPSGRISETTGPNFFAVYWFFFLHFHLYLYRSHPQVARISYPATIGVLRVTDLYLNRPSFHLSFNRSRSSLAGLIVKVNGNKKFGSSRSPNLNLYTSSSRKSVRGKQILFVLGLRLVDPNYRLLLCV